MNCYRPQFSAVSDWLLARIKLDSRGRGLNAQTEAIQLMCWQPIWQPTGSIIWQQMSKSPRSLHTTGACHSLLLKPCVWESVGDCEDAKNTGRAKVKKEKRSRNTEINDAKGYFHNQRTQVSSLLRGVSVLSHVLTCIKLFYKRTSQRKTLIKARMCEITVAAAAW